jgi:uncharacterized membrane protein YcaP (DUF421 family)
MVDWYGTIERVLGLSLEAKDLTFVQISLRGIIVFIVSLIILRVGNKRFLAKMTAFDAIVGFILASMLARAVNGTAAFFPTLGGGFIIIGIHALFANLAFRSHRFGNLVKGKSEIIVENGSLRKKEMQRSKISEQDIEEEARLNGGVLGIEQIQRATLERSGELSIIKKQPK